MSWYTDPQLFITYVSPGYGYYISRIVKYHNSVLFLGDLVAVEKLDFSKHLSLGNNKESDYDALKSILAKNYYGIDKRKVMYVNCQGVVVYADYTTTRAIWSREAEIDSIINSLLPSNINPKETAVSTEKSQAVEKTNSELVAEISLLKGKSENLQEQLSQEKTEVTNLKEQLNQEKKEVTNLQEQLSQEKIAKQAFEKQVFDLAEKLEECRGAGGRSADEKPWMSGDTSVPSHWVPLEELDVLYLPKNTHVTIMEGPSKPIFVQDVTTNVPVDRFYRGTFIVAVNVEELTPDKDKARFDPEFWGVYTNGGIRYAARKRLVTEMSV